MKKRDVNLNNPHDCRWYLKNFSIQLPGKKPAKVESYTTFSGEEIKVDEMNDFQVRMIAVQVYQDLDWRASNAMMN